MTQGVVTVRVDGKVVMKVVTGMDGMNARRVARAIKKLGRVPGLREAYDLALKADFGDETRLVVMGKNRSYHNTGGPLPRRYRKTFDIPTFNPRWKHGTADHIVIVDL